jgi:hypothetical protein
MRRMSVWLCAAAVVMSLGGCSDRLLTSSVILDADSSQGGPPGNFALPGRWDLKYSWDCSRQNSRMMSGSNQFGFVVYNTDDQSTAFQHPDFNGKGPTGVGTLHYDRGGEFQITIDSMCDWRVQVIDRSQA